jgi:AcrR family transcriptional regulator
MPRSALSETEIAEFRSRAIAIAERLFAESGLTGVTMRAVAAALGCSAMTPYRYFEDQEHLMAAVRAHAFEQLARNQDAIASLPHASALERVRALRASYLQFGRQNANLYALMFTLLPPTKPRPDLERAAIASFVNLRQAVVEAVQAGALKGDAAKLAHLIWAELHGLVSLHNANKLNFGLTLDELSACSLIDGCL